MSLSRYYRITPRFWIDPVVRNDWSEDMRVLALYLQTSPHRNMVGLFHCPPSYSMNDLQWTEKRYQAAFNGLLERGFVLYDPEAHVILLPTALADDPLANDNQVTGAMRALATVPQTPLIQQLAQVCEELASQSDDKRIADRLETLAERIRNRFATVPEPFRTTVTVPVTVPVTGSVPVTATEDIHVKDQSTADAVDVSASVGSLRPEEITAEWNEVCGHRLPAAQKLTADRRRHIKARLQEPGRDLAWWRDYFRRIAASEFCCGGSDGTGWRASIDWAIQSEATVIKVLEGQYDTRAAKPKGYRPAEILR